METALLIVACFILWYIAQALYVISHNLSEIGKFLENREAEARENGEPGMKPGSR